MVPAARRSPVEPLSTAISEAQGRSSFIHTTHPAATAPLPKNPRPTEAAGQKPGTRRPMPPTPGGSPSPGRIRYAVPGRSSVCPAACTGKIAEGATPRPTSGLAALANAPSTGPPTRPLQARASVAQGIEHRSPKAGVAGSNPAGGTTRYRSDLGFLPQGRVLLGLGLLVRGRLRERCVSGRGVDLPNSPRRISTIRHGDTASSGSASASGGVFSGIVRARGTSRAAASAIARSASGSRLVYVSEVMVIEEWPSISWMSFRPAPAA